LKQLPGFHCQINEAFNSSELKPLDYYIWKNAKRSITGTFQNQIYRQTQANAANDSLLFLLFAVTAMFCGFITLA